MEISVQPARPGQICKIISPVPDLETEEVYIVTEDPEGLSENDPLQVVNLKELQRNIRNPENAARESVRKGDLVVVGQTLEDYIASWNSR